jgi:hypothetical protein
MQLHYSTTLGAIGTSGALIVLLTVARRSGVRRRSPLLLVAVAAAGRS